MSFKAVDQFLEETKEDFGYDVPGSPDLGRVSNSWHTQQNSPTMRYFNNVKKSDEKRRGSPLKLEVTNGVQSITDDDLDSLLEEFEIEPKSLRKTETEPETSAVSTPRKRCEMVFIGGTDTPSGVSSSNSKKICDTMRCTSCDFKTSYFNNYVWDDTIEYLFLRNNFPDFQKLKSKLIPKKGWNAFACQCQWKNSDSPQCISGFGAIWVCGGHKA